MVFAGNVTFVDETLMVETPAVPSAYTDKVRAPSASARTTLFPTAPPATPIVPGPVIVAVIDSATATLEAFKSVTASVDAAAFVEETVATFDAGVGSPKVDVTGEATLDKAAGVATVIATGVVIVEIDCVVPL